MPDGGTANGIKVTNCQSPEWDGLMKEAFRSSSTDNCNPAIISNITAFSDDYQDISIFSIDDVQNRLTIKSHCANQGLFVKYYGFNYCAFTFSSWGC